LFQGEKHKFPDLAQKYLMEKKQKVVDESK